MRSSPAVCPGIRVVFRSACVVVCLFYKCVGTSRSAGPVAPRELLISPHISSLIRPSHIVYTYYILFYYKIFSFVPSIFNRTLMFMYWCVINVLLNCTNLPSRDVSVHRVIKYRVGTGFTSCWRVTSDWIVRCSSEETTSLNVTHSSVYFLIGFSVLF